MGAVFREGRRGLLTTARAGFVWGYRHYVVFAAAAAVGAGIAVNVEQVIGSAHAGALAVATSTTVPVAVLLIAVWALQWVPAHVAGWHGALAPAGAACALLATVTRQPVLVTGLVMAALVAVSIATTIVTTPDRA